MALVRNVSTMAAVILASDDRIILLDWANCVKPCTDVGGTKMIRLESGNQKRRAESYSYPIWNTVLIEMLLSYFSSLKFFFLESGALFCTSINFKMKQKVL